jgi:hypothetical protein
MPIIKKPCKVSPAGLKKSLATTYSSTLFSVSIHAPLTLKPRLLIALKALLSSPIARAIGSSFITFISNARSGLNG